MDKTTARKLLTGYLGGKVPKKLRDTFLLRAFGFLRIPLLFSIQPSVLELDDEHAVVRVKLSRWTKNHWGSMYFGTLAMGADCAVGLLAMHHIWCLEADDVALLFKDFHADFLKRADAHVLFICDEGLKAKELVERAVATGERQNASLSARAVSEKNPSEVLATFTLTLSLKKKSPKEK